MIFQSKSEELLIFRQRRAVMNIEEEIIKVKKEIEVLTIQHNQMETQRQQILQMILKKQGALEFLESNLKKE